MQDEWLSQKADGIQEFADRHDTKNFYFALKDIYGPATSGSAPLLSADGGILITENVAILAGQNTFILFSVVSLLSTRKRVIAYRLPQVNINDSFTEPPISQETLNTKGNYSIIEWKVNSSRLYSS
jgi:hypothetical protein